MPLMFQVLRCYKCSVFQVHQTKKSNKWQCKLCGEKQSTKRHYGLGTAKDCRLHVQKLNGMRGEIDELSENTQNDTDSDTEYNDPASIVIEKPPKKGKWSDYVDDEEINESKTEDVAMYIGNSEIVLETKKMKRNFKTDKFKVPKKNIDPVEETEVQMDSNECIAMSRMLNEKSNVFKPERFIRENYCKTPNYYNSTELQKPINAKGNSKVTTDISLTVNTPKLEIQESQSPISFIPPVVNKNSRWAQYVDIEENSEEENNDVLKSHNDPFDSDKKAQSMFSLCDDKDLDDVLDI